MSTFETFDKATGNRPDAKFECGICWHVYDPAEGDTEGHILPGTVFADIPDDWSCPNCDAPQSKFLVLEDESAA